MEIEEEIVKKAKLQSLILEFLENNDDNDQNLNELIYFINDNRISKNKLDFQDLLNLLLHISNFHYRETNFFPKICQILQIFNPDIQTLFSDIEIYTIFEKNKLLVYFLILDKIIVPSKSLIDNILSKEDYYNYGWYHEKKLHTIYFLYYFIKPYI